MTDDITPKLAAMDAKLESLRHDIARIEPMQQRNYDNVDSTRHALNNSMQKIMGAIDQLQSMLKDIRSQASGAGKALGWLWPVISALIALAAVGVVAYLGYR